jgi:hypothetical protein
MNVQSKKPQAPQLPNSQACAKCGAEFRWEPSNPAEKVSPLVLRLAKPSDECDCGYGTVVPSF